VNSKIREIDFQNHELKLYFHVFFKKLKYVVSV